MTPAIITITAASGIFLLSLSAIAPNFGFNTETNADCAAAASSEGSFVAIRMCKPESVLVPATPHPIPELKSPNGACLFQPASSRIPAMSHTRSAGSWPGATEREYCWPENGFSSSVINGLSAVSILRGVSSFFNSNLACDARSFNAATAIALRLFDCTWVRISPAIPTMRMSADNLSTPRLLDRGFIQFVKSAIDSPMTPMPTTAVAMYPANSQREDDVIAAAISSFVKSETRYGDILTFAALPIGLAPITIIAIAWATKSLR